MKNLIKALIYVSLPILFCVGVRCEEIQLSDYIYTNHKDLLGGYNYAESAAGNNIIKPDGTLLYAPGKYYVKYYDEFYARFPNGTDDFAILKFLPFISARYHFPQNAAGNRFRVFNNKDDLCTITDENGKPLIPFSDEIPFAKGKYYFIRFKYVNKGEIFTVIDGTTGKYLNTNLLKFYLSADMAHEKVACIKYAEDYDGTTGFEDRFVNIYFYNKGKLYDKIENAKAADYMYPKAHFYENDPQLYFDLFPEIIDKYGEKLYFSDVPGNTWNLSPWEEDYVIPPILLYSVFKDPETGETSDCWDYEHMVEPEYDRKKLGLPDYDSSYYFKEKKMGGRTYYALFRNTKASVTPEFPEGKENIKAAYESGLINNSFLCHYNEGITKYDFSVILTKMYCKLKDKDVSDFLTGDLFIDIHFKDTHDAYCLFAYKKAFADCKNHKFAPSSVLTEEQVCKSLETFARNYDAYEEWCNARTVLPSVRVCTREEACSEIYRLFECLTSTDHTQEINNIDITEDPLFNVKQKPMGIEIYNALGLSLAFLLIMYLRNNKLTRQ